MGSGICHYVMRVALLFPGQGAQRPGFLERLPRHSAVQATLDEAARTLGRDLSGLDDAVALQSTGAVQLSTVIAAVAASRALLAEGVMPDAVAGLSVGAFAAAVTCGSVTFSDALRLVSLRAESMARAAPRGSGMTALLGLTERDARGLVARVSERFPLYLASVNAPTEVVVSGGDAALAAAAAEAQALGGSARRLQVAIPSHCPIMAGVSQALRNALSALQVSQPQLPYVTNTRARVAAGAAEVAEDLSLNVSRTVRWHDSVTLLYELGCRLYIESLPGEVLSTLVMAAFPEARAVALDSVPLATAVTLARRAPYR
jgi:malonate decarboxylase epsilon subunit